MQRTRWGPWVLVLEYHKIWVEKDRVENMTDDDNGERYDDTPRCNLPSHRDHGEYQSDHAPEDEER